MELTSKDKLIEEKFKALKPPADFDLLWKKEKSARFQLLSVNSLIIKEFNRDLSRIENWCLEQGFDGMEIRIQDFIGFTENFDPNPLKKIRFQGNLTVHLSDWASWIPFYKQDQARLLRTFYTPANVRKYFSGDKPEVMIERLTRELDIAGELDARVATWHANQIDYDDILFGDRKYSDQAVISAVRQFTEDLIKRDSGFAKLLTLENGSAIDRGVRRLADFREIFINRDLNEVGVTFDTAHSVAVLGQEAGDRPDSIDQRIKKELADNPEILKRIKAVHLSDSLTTKEFTKEASPDQLKKAKADFWYKRQIVRDVVIDDHIPVGFVFKSAKTVLEMISANSDGKLCVIWELRPASFEVLKQAIILQKNALVS
ncbi:MAG: hypothetical protein PHI73_03460 [Patescibacteria group bacterium]|nr:hypothetical protein [Patescibacteria group bacterium]